MSADVMLMKAKDQTCFILASPSVGEEEEECQGHRLRGSNLGSNPAFTPSDCDGRNSRHVSKPLFYHL